MCCAAVLRCCGAAVLSPVQPQNLPRSTRYPAPQRLGARGTKRCGMPVSCCAGCGVVRINAGIGLRTTATHDLRTPSRPRASRASRPKWGIDMLCEWLRDSAHLDILASSLIPTHGPWVGGRARHPVDAWLGILQLPTWWSGCEIVRGLGWMRVWKNLGGF